MIAVQKQQRKYQVYRFGNALFMDLCMLFGDGNAAHIFTGTHRAVIENFVLPFIKGSLGSLVLVVDDSVFIAGNPEWVEEYNIRYRMVLEKLGLEVKGHDPELKKTFLPSTKGEVLGYWVDSIERTWSVSPNKISDMLRQIDHAVNLADLNEPKPMTLKTLQRIQGKLADLGRLSPLIRVRNMTIARELAGYERTLHHENEWVESQQTKSCQLTTRAKKDLAFLRAVVANLQQHPLPLCDPRLPRPIAGEVTIFCDASGDTNRDAYLGILVMEGPLCNQDLALAYALPRAFLEAEDDRDRNCCNTMLLELLCVLVIIVEWGPLLRSKSLLFISDSLNLDVIMRNGRTPKGANTNFALQAVYELAAELEATVSLQWKRRKSCTWTIAADDLSHADFHKLPRHLMRDPAEKELQLPNPIRSVLLDAASNKDEGFPDLRRRIQQDWKAKGWCRNLWKHDTFFL